MILASPEQKGTAQLERELAYYRRECNDLGARLLRLQEEQSQAFREARRSRTVAKLIREAYRLADADVGADAIGTLMLETIVENAMCDGAALLQEDPAGPPGAFRVTHALGHGVDAVSQVIRIPAVPVFFFTTSRTPIEPPAYELTAILRVPYVLWAYDRTSGVALILGNQSESNVSRPFEPGDQELVEGALSVYIDVLLRKNAEEELRAAKAAAESASSARTRFLATLTHELRSPLNAIIGYSEMMVPGSGFNLSVEKREGYAEQILESGRHLLGLIDGILDYASLERAAPSLRLEWLGLGSLLGGTVGVAREAGRARGVEVRTELPGEAIEVQVDPLRFRQILHNLLGNAVKFSHDGAAVVVGVRRLADGGIAFSVRDRGVGMRAEDVPRALEPFQQIDSGLQRQFGGAGLGLPIAKGLAEAHGGNLAIESVPGDGTTVTVTLPPGRVRPPAG